MIFVKKKRLWNCDFCENWDFQSVNRDFCLSVIRSLLTHSLWWATKDGIKLNADERSRAQNVAHDHRNGQLDSLDFGFGDIFMRMSSGQESLGLWFGLITGWFNSDPSWILNCLHFLRISQIILERLINEMDVGTNSHLSGYGLSLSQHTGANTTFYPENI